MRSLRWSLKERESRFARALVVLVGSLVLCALSTGCSTLSKSTANADSHGLLIGSATYDTREPRAAAGAVERPESSVEYDVLVGEFAIRDGDFDAAQEAFARAVVKDPDSPQIHDKLARLSFRTNDTDTALFHAAKAVELAPDDIDSRIFLARLHRVRRDVGGMESALRDENGLPIDLTASLMLYQAYMDSDRFADALSLAEEIVKRDPENANGYIAIATIHERMGQYDEAEVALRKALELHNDKLTLYSRIAQLHRNAGNREREIALYREVLEDEPSHYGTLISLGAALLGEDRFDEARVVYEEVVERYPGDLQALRQLASIYFATDDHDAAVALLEGAIEAYPHAHELIYSLGHVQRAMGNTDVALVSFAQVSEGNPTYVEARLQMVAILEEREDYAGALDQLQRVRELRPNRTLEFHLAGLLARAGRAEEGIALLETMLAENPRDEETLYQLGVLHGILGHREEALRYMTAALELNPENPNVLNYIGYTFAEKGERLDEAEALIRKALDLRPGDGYITDSLGWVYYMRARDMYASSEPSEVVPYLEQARHHLSLAAELTGGDPVISEHLGDVYLMLEDKRRALELYEEAIELQPRGDEQPELMQKLEGLRQELSDQ